MRFLTRHFANDPLAVAWAVVNLAMAIGCAVAVTKKQRTWAIAASVGFVASWAVLVWKFPRAV